MGRSDAVAVVLECVREWRALGARVTFEDGWDTRGNGTRADYLGGLVHHTASPSSPARPFPTRRMLIEGRPDLHGPLTNVGGPWCEPHDPWLHVVAAHPANHAGASGGRAMGPLPRTSLFNRHVLGLEIDYAGTAPMAPGQARAALIFTAGVTRVLGRGSADWVRGHAETSITGKWDPGWAPNRTIDLPAFRRQALQLLTTGGDFMTALTADEQRELLNGVRDLRRWLAPTEFVPPGGDPSQPWTVTVGHAVANTYVATFFGGPSTGDRSLFQAIADAAGDGAALPRVEVALAELAAAVRTAGVDQAAVETAIRGALAAIAAGPASTGGS